MVDASVDIGGRTDEPMYSPQYLAVFDIPSRALRARALIDALGRWGLAVADRWYGSQYWSGERDHLLSQYPPQEWLTSEQGILQLERGGAGVHCCVYFERLGPVASVGAILLPSNYLLVVEFTQQFLDELVARHGDRTAQFFADLSRAVEGASGCVTWECSIEAAARCLNGELTSDDMQLLEEGAHFRALFAPHASTATAALKCAEVFFELADSSPRCILSWLDGCPRPLFKQQS